MNKTAISGPHLTANKSISGIMSKVILALFPATGFGIFIFGWSALYLCLLSIISALIFEALCLKIKGTKIKTQLFDGSALLTGLLVAMSLPPFAPWWIAVVGSGIAIILGKQVYGGLGQNLFNPAMLARVGLLISFPIEMTTWIMPKSIFFSPGFFDSFSITFSGLTNFDGLSGATTLGAIKTGFSLNQTLPGIVYDYSAWQAFLGWEPGSLGETSSLLLLAGGIWLLHQGIIQWHIPISLLVTIASLSLVSHWFDPRHFMSVWMQLNSGALMLVAFFIATDYVTSPNTSLGQLIFGAGCGLLIFVIRSWGGYPEGTGFAILLMNAVTPLIDHYIKPRIYGHYRNGKPIDIAQAGDQS